MNLLVKLWKKWLKIARIIGNFQAQVLFTIFYFLILFPVGIKIRFSADPLNLKGIEKKSSYNSWVHPEEDLKMSRKPY